MTNPRLPRFPAELIDLDYRQRIICDDCKDSRTAFYDADEFRRMIDDAKAAGWLMRISSGGDRTHVCPKCVPPENGTGIGTG